MTVGELRRWLDRFEPSTAVGILLQDLRQGWAVHEIAYLAAPTRPHPQVPVMLQPGPETLPIWPAREDQP